MPKTTTQLQGGIDLATLGQAKVDPPGTFTCVVPMGCGLLCKMTEKGPHKTLVDCLDVAVPYVQLALKLQIAMEEQLEEINRLKRGNKDLLAANQRLAEERVRLRKEANGSVSGGIGQEETH